MLAKKIAPTPRKIAMSGFLRIIVPSAGITRIRFYGYFLRLPSPTEIGNHPIDFCAKRFSDGIR
jgi:hypothetical protein